MGDVTQHFHKNNIRTVVVTINEDDSDRRMADSIAEDLHYTFNVKSFKDLVGIIEKTVNAACFGMYLINDLVSILTTLYRLKRTRYRLL